MSLRWVEGWGWDGVRWGGSSWECGGGWRGMEVGGGRVGGGVCVECGMSVCGGGGEVGDRGLASCC